MGAILKQLVGRGDIPDYVREAFQAAKRNFGGRGPELPDLLRMLKITISVRRRPVRPSLGSDGTDYGS